ncbi:hypothetical protein COO60DRAFT_1682790 [Scenedesmus sp. NREL 46B-D3]|nr:hypothetical protein COO60DRAFT_1682790 [Scenedesmus sp. NREL 46B-D3]
MPGGPGSNPLMARGFVPPQQQGLSPGGFAPGRCQVLAAESIQALQLRAIVRGVSALADDAAVALLRDLQQQLLHLFVKELLQLLQALVLHGNPFKHMEELPLLLWQKGISHEQVRVTGPKPVKTRSGGPDAAADAAAALQLERTLDQHSLVLLAWRLQHEPGLQLRWLAELLGADEAAAPGAAAPGAATPAAAGGPASQARSAVRRQLAGAAVDSRQQ